MPCPKHPKPTAFYVYASVHLCTIYCIFMESTLHWSLPYPSSLRQVARSSDLVQTFSSPHLSFISVAEMKIKDNHFRPFQRFDQSLWWIYPELLVHCPIVQDLKIVQRSLPDMAQSAELILHVLYKQPFARQRWRKSSIWCFCVQRVNKIQRCSSMRHDAS